MNATIYDVSRLSGVSIATVSRTFANPDRVRDATRQKVFEAAEILHYSPNAIARVSKLGWEFGVGLSAQDQTDYLTGEETRLQMQIKIGRASCRERV